MYIKDNELVIRDSVKEDAIILCTWWNDGKVMAHAGFPDGLGTSIEKVASQIESNSIDHKRLMIECNDIPIGEMSYRKVEDGVAEIGIKICNFRYQNKGYGKRYLTMLINCLFNELCFKKIVLDTNLNNVRAQHVYEKLGFKKVRVNYNSWKDQHGNYQSSVDYELINKDIK